MGRELARLMAELRNLGYAPLHPSRMLNEKAFVRGMSVLWILETPEL